MPVVWNGEDDIIKVVTLGESGVGKSSLALRFVKNEFSHYMDSTVGACYLSKSLDLLYQILPSRKVTFKIWDIGGQDKFNALVPLYYRGAGAALLIFDITRPETLKSLQRWVDELKEKGPPDMVLALCGNKADLQEDRRVTEEEGRRFADDIGAAYFEVSAREGQNVPELFRDIGEKVTALQDASSTVCTGMSCNAMVESFEVEGLLPNWCCFG